MKILVLGGDGMLGHRAVRSLSARHDVGATIRGSLRDLAERGPLDEGNTFPGVDVRNDDALIEALAAFRPDAVVNAAGIVKQRDAAKERLASIDVNARFPHRLALLGRAAGFRVVHVSTDCVFSGVRGDYAESDAPDPVDVYGLSKLLGEVHEAPAVTLRTSIIGLELKARQGLVEWALSESGRVRGFTKAVFSGLTTAELTRVIELVVTEHADVHGVWHVSSQPIAKHDLLVELYRRLGRTDVDVVPDDALVCDRSLSSEAFAARTGYRAPTWPTMLDELVEEIREREAA